MPHHIVAKSVADAAVAVANCSSVHGSTASPKLCANLGVGENVTRKAQRHGVVLALCRSLRTNLNLYAHIVVTVVQESVSIVRSATYGCSASSRTVLTLVV
jgi:hypothetical protein